MCDASLLATEVVGVGGCTVGTQFCVAAARSLLRRLWHQNDIPSVMLVAMLVSQIFQLNVGTVFFKVSGLNSQSQLLVRVVSGKKTTL